MFFHRGCYELYQVPGATAALLCVHVTFPLICCCTLFLWVQVGEASDTKYRSVTGIDMYVPLIRVKALTDPLLAIDVTEFPTE